jgi:hypothetical protein
MIEKRKEGKKRETQEEKRTTYSSPTLSRLAQSQAFQWGTFAFWQTRSAAARGPSV